jgi:hypothetical protein
MKKISDSSTSKELTEKEPYLINEHLIWWTYPKTTKWKLAQRDKLDAQNDKDIIDGINITTIVDSACFVEGTINDILNEVIHYKSSYADEFKERLVESLGDRLDNAQWTDYVKIFEIVFGVDIKNKIDPMLWKGISALFTFRNMLVHGKPITVEFYEKSSDKCEVKVPKKYHTVFQYLLERKLLNQYYPREQKDVDLITNEICNHFFAISKTFIRELLKVVPQYEKEDIEEGILDSLDAGD